MLFRRTSLEMEQVILRQEGHSSHLTLGKLAAKATVGGHCCEQPYNGCCSSWLLGCVWFSARWLIIPLLNSKSVFLTENRFSRNTPLLECRKQVTQGSS